MLRQRVITALVLAALLTGILSFDDRLPWLLFLLAAGAFAAEEWAALGGHAAPMRAGYALLTTLAAGALFAPLPARLLATPLLALACVFWCALVPLLLWKGWRIPRGLPFLATGWLLILSTLCALARLWTHGVVLLIASMAVIWVSDITAYFSGRAWGRRKLAPAISPGKTWEGVGGALTGVLLFGVALAILAPAGTPLAAAHARAGAGWWPLLLVLAVLGIEGDLFESWLKRCAGVKDSGWILPGHGGVLDRIDALTAALPLAALLADLLPGMRMLT